MSTAGREVVRYAQVLALPDGAPPAASMQPHPFGRWVTWADYRALWHRVAVDDLARASRVCAECPAAERLTDAHKQLAQVRERNQHYRQALAAIFARMTPDDPDAWWTDEDTDELVSRVAMMVAGCEHRRSHGT
jgi:hypothetical protein